MTVELWEAALLTAVGLVGGFLNVVAGGGSLLTIPTLLFLGLPGPVANGSNRIAILLQNLSGIYTFMRDGYSNFKLSVSLTLATLPGAIIGAMLGIHLHGRLFELVVASIMVVVMVIMVFDKQESDTNAVTLKPQFSKFRFVLGHLAMILVGFWGGFIQIGAGFIIIPIMHRILGLSLVEVNMHKTFIIAGYTLVALLIFASQVTIEWGMGLCLAAGMAVGGALGAKASIVGGERLIRLVLILTLFGLIVHLLFF